MDGRIKKAMRFTTWLDPVIALDYNSRVTYKAPDISVAILAQAKN